MTTRTAAQYRQAESAMKRNLKATLRRIAEKERLIFRAIRDADHGLLRSTLAELGRLPKRVKKNRAAYCEALTACLERPGGLDFVRYLADVADASIDVDLTDFLGRLLTAIELARSQVERCRFALECEVREGPDWRHANPNTYLEILPPKGCPSPRHRIRIALGALKRIELEPKPKLPLGYGDATALHEMRAWEVAHPEKT